MEEFKVALPKDCNLENITTNIEDGNLIVVYEPKKEFKFGDYVVYKKNKRVFCGIIISIIDDKYVLVFDPFVSDNIVKEYNTYNKKYINYANQDQATAITLRMNEINCTVDYNKNDIVYKRWRAKYGYTFYYITYGGLIDSSIDYGRKSNDTLYNVGNYYQTEELALQALPFVLAAYKHNNK